MKSSIAGESFHRQDFSSVALQRKNQAGKHWLAIHENGARAAFPQLAAVLRTRVPKILAQNFQQSLIGSEREVGFLAIQIRFTLNGEETDLSFAEACFRMTL